MLSVGVQVCVKAGLWGRLAVCSLQTEHIVNTWNLQHLLIFFGFLKAWISHTDTSSSRTSLWAEPVGEILVETVALVWIFLSELAGFVAATNPNILMRKDFNLAMDTVSRFYSIFLQPDIICFNPIWIYLIWNKQAINL